MRHEVRGRGHAQAPREERAAVETQREPHRPRGFEERHDVGRRRGLQQVRVRRVAGPDRFGLRRHLLRRRHPLAPSRPVPPPRADDDPVRSAANSILEPVRTLQRELRHDLVPHCPGSRRGWR